MHVPESRPLGHQGGDAEETGSVGWTLTSFGPESRAGLSQRLRENLSLFGSNSAARSPGREMRGIDPCLKMDLCLVMPTLKWRILSTDLEGL
jgi:hypothetical protein